MERDKLLQEILEFKRKLKEFRELTQGKVDNWSQGTKLEEKTNPSKEDIIRYDELKSELIQKQAFFGESLSEKTKVSNYSDEGKKISERSGFGIIFTSASNLTEERLKIYNLNSPDKSSYNKIWSIILYGIEKYIGELKYFNERRNDLVKREKEIEKKEEDLKNQEERIEVLKKVYEELTHIKRGLPETIRAEVTKEIKAQHREIEKYTNPHTNSQQSQK